MIDPGFGAFLNFSIEIMFSSGKLLPFFVKLINAA